MHKFAFIAALSLPLTAGFVVTTARTALAETRAEELFQEGRKAMKASDWPAAVTALAQSYKLEPAPGTLLNLAECELHTQHLVEALEHFKQVEIALPTQDKRRNVAVERALSLAPRVPRLVVKLGASAPPGTEVYRGDTRVEPGATTLVNPGAVALRVVAPGKKERALTATAKENETVTLTAEPEADAAATTPAPLAGGTAGATSTATPSASDTGAPRGPGAPGNGKRTAGYVVGGIGVASLGVGIVTGIMTLGKASTVKDHCDAALACDPAGVDAGSSGKTLSLVSTITVAAGLVGIGVGTFLIVTSKGKGSSAAAASPTPTTAFAPVVTPDYAGATLFRSF